MVGQHDAAQEIRSGDIDRDEGVALVRRYDGEFPDRWASEIFKYLSITKSEFPEAFPCFEQPEMTSDYFNALTDKFRSPHLWRLTDEMNGNYGIVLSLKMNRNIRVIARLDLKNGSLIKGVYEGGEKVGDPAYYAAEYAFRELMNY